MITFNLANILEEEKRKYLTKKDLEAMLQKDTPVIAEDTPDVDHDVLKLISNKYNIDLTPTQPMPDKELDKEYKEHIAVKDEIKRLYGIDFAEKRDDSIGRQLLEVPEMAKKGLATGVLRAVKVAPEVVEFALADVAGIESVKKVTSPIIKSLETTIHEVSPETEKIDSMADLRWWAYHLPDAAVSIAAMLIGGKASAVAAMAKYGKALSAAKAAGDMKNVLNISNKIRTFAQAGVYGTGMAMEAAGARERVRAYEQATGKELGWGQKIVAIAGTGIVAGSLEALSVTKIFDGFAGKSLVNRVLKSMGIEGGTEGAQEIVANAFQKYGYDPKQDLLANVVEAIALGAAIGAFSGSVSKRVDTPLRKPELRIDSTEEKPHRKPDPITVAPIEQEKVFEEAKAKEQKEKLETAEKIVTGEKTEKIATGEKTEQADIRFAYKGLAKLEKVNTHIPDNHPELKDITNPNELSIAKNVLINHNLAAAHPKEFDLVMSTLDAIAHKPTETWTKTEAKFVERAVLAKNAPFKHFADILIKPKAEPVIPPAPEAVTKEGEVVVPPAPEAVMPTEEAPTMQEAVSPAEEQARLEDSAKEDKIAVEETYPPAPIGEVAEAEKAQVVPIQPTPPPETKQVWEMTLEEVKNWDFPVPEGGASKTPKTVLSWKREDYETLHDLATQEDDFRLKEALGKGWTDWKPTLHLIDKIKRNEPITIYRASEEGPIIPGSYVSTSLEYVKKHQRDILQGKGQIEKMIVKPSDLMTYGDPHEFIYIPESVESYHKNIIQQALAEGKPIPAEVLKDYPDLKPEISEEKTIRKPPPTKVKTKQSPTPKVRAAVAKGGIAPKVKGKEKADTVKATPTPKAKQQIANLYTKAEATKELANRPSPPPMPENIAQEMEKANVDEIIPIQNWIADKVNPQEIKTLISYGDGWKYGIFNGKFAFETAWDGLVLQGDPPAGKKDSTFYQFDSQHAVPLYDRVITPVSVISAPREIDFLQTMVVFDDGTVVSERLFTIVLSKYPDAIFKYDKDKASVDDLITIHSKGEVVGLLLPQQQEPLKRLSKIIDFASNWNPQAKDYPILVVGKQEAKAPSFTIPIEIEEIMAKAFVFRFEYIEDWQSRAVTDSEIKSFLELKDGWIVSNLRGEKAYSNSHFIIIGKPPKGQFISSREIDFETAVPSHATIPITPKGVMLIQYERETQHVVVFDDKIMIDERYFSMFVNRFPDVNFKGSGDFKLPILAYSGDKLVGVVMPIAVSRTADPNALYKIIDHIIKGKPTTDVVRGSTLRLKRPGEPIALPFASMLEATKLKEGVIKFGEGNNELTIKAAKIKDEEVFEIIGYLPETVKEELIERGVIIESIKNKTRAYIPIHGDTDGLLKLEEIYGDARFEPSPNLPDPESTITLEINGFQSIYEAFERWTQNRPKDVKQVLKAAINDIEKNIKDKNSKFYRSSYDIDREIRILEKMSRNGELNGYMLQLYNRYKRGNIDKNVLMRESLDFVNKNLKESYNTWWKRLQRHDTLNENFKIVMFGKIIKEYAVKDNFGNYRAVSFSRNSLNLPLPYDEESLLIFYDKAVKDGVKGSWAVEYLKVLEETQYSKIAEMYAKGIPAKDGDISGAWIFFKDKDNSNDIEFQQNVTALTVLAQQTPWCTKEAAASHLASGQSWVFVDDKLQARAIIFFSPFTEQIHELRGILPNQGVEDELVNIVRAFAVSNLKGGKKFIEELELKKELIALRDSGKQIHDEDIREIANRYNYNYTAALKESGDAIHITKGTLNSEVDYDEINLIELLDINVSFDANRINFSDKRIKKLSISRDIKLDNLKEIESIQTNSASGKFPDLTKAERIVASNLEHKEIEAPLLESVDSLKVFKSGKIIMPALKTGDINILMSDFVDLRSYIGSKKGEEPVSIHANTILLNSLSDGANAALDGGMIYAPKLKEFFYIRITNGIANLDSASAVGQINSNSGFVYAPNLLTAEYVNLEFGNREQAIYAPKLKSADTIYATSGEGTSILSLPSLVQARWRLRPIFISPETMKIFDIAYLPSLKITDRISIDNLISDVKHLYINKYLAEQYDIKEGVQSNGNRVTFVDTVEPDKFADLDAIKKEREGFVLGFLGGQTIYDFTVSASKNLLRAFGIKAPQQRNIPDVDGKEVKEMFDETLEARKAKNRFSLKELKEIFVKGVLDRSGNVRAKLLEVNADLGEESMMNHYKIAGAHSNAIRIIEENYNEVFGGLSPSMKEVLNRIIQAKRTAQIDEYLLDVATISSVKDFARRFRNLKVNVSFDKESKNFSVIVKNHKGEGIASSFNKDKKEALVNVAKKLVSIGYQVTLPTHPKNIKGETHKSYLKNIIELEGITEEQLSLLTGRANSYFSQMKAQLKKLLDEGLISTSVYNTLSNYVYSPRIFFQHIDPEGIARRVMGDIIKPLSEGSANLLYNDAEMLFAHVVNRIESRIFINKANKSLYKIAEEIPDNGIVRLAKVIKKTPDDDFIYEKTPKHHTKIPVYIDGTKHIMFMPNEYAEEWMLSNPLISQHFANMLSWVSGAELLKATATRYNPFFAIVNFFRDAAMVYGATTEYSPILPVAMMQMSHDIATVANDVVSRKGRVIDYIKEGGGMELFTHSRRFTAGKGQVGRTLQQMGNLMGWTGETSELMIRIALRERAIKNGKAPEIATWTARSYLDFSQGGQVIKAADTVIPYLNAGIQATRSVVRAARKNPKIFALKFFQIGVLAALLNLINREENPEALDMIPDRIKVSNFVITTPFYYYDRDGEKRYYYFKIPKDQGQRIIATIFEGIIEKQYGGKFPTNEFLQSLTDFANVMPTRLVPPIISAFIGYVANTNMWTNERIWKGARVEPKEEYRWSTPSLAIAIGEATGASPERLTHATTRVIAQGNPFTGLAGWGLGSILKSMPQEEADKVMAQIIAENTGFRRILSTTVPGARLRDPLEEAKIAESTRRLKQHREFDQIVVKFINKEALTSDVMNYIREQPLEDRRRLKTRMETYIKLSNVSDRSWWANMMELPPETRAYVFYSRYLEASDSERARLLKELKVAPGILTDRFIKKLKELDSFEKAIFGI